MSACVSRHGEYSSHEPDEVDPLTCGRCADFDEDEARRIVAVQNRVRELLAGYEMDDGHTSDAAVLGHVAEHLGLRVVRETDCVANCHAPVRIEVP